MAKSIEMATSKSKKKGYLGTYLLFRPFCCDKNYIAHLEINANKLDFLRVFSPSKMSSE